MRTGREKELAHGDRRTFLPRHPYRRAAISFCALLLLCSIRTLAQDYDHQTLCMDGDGGFQAESASGVAVKVNAAKSGGMATRACEATLIWNKQTLTVATNATQIDLDGFGIDLGLGAPVAAFQIKSSANQCCMEYQIYSLEKPPRLLRSITGGDFFGAADMDLDGRIAVWTTDAAALNGFERLDLSELDSAPTIVLRFEHGALLDASAEFAEHFDRQITWLRKQLTPGDLRDFKNSDGKLLPSSPASAERTHHLRQVKIKVLEIVWDYLYSGRETQAWSSLAEMWPDSDVPRIRAALVEARARGILAQTTGISGHKEKHEGKKSKRVSIFDATAQSFPGRPEIIPPKPIVLRRPPPAETSSPGSSSQGSSSAGSLPAELLLDLIIDSAGKVRSAEPAGNAKSIDPALLRAPLGWKFIPALHSGRPVASHVRMAVSLRQ